MRVFFVMGSETECSGEMETHLFTFLLVQKGFSTGETTPKLENTAHVITPDWFSRFCSNLVTVKTTSVAHCSQFSANFELFVALKISSVCSDALSESFRISVHRTPEVFLWNALNCVVNCNFQFMQSLQVLPSQQTLEFSENPIVWRTQIRGVSGVGHLGDVLLSDETLDTITGVRRRIVMQDGPALVSPHHWMMAPDVFPQVLEYLQVHPSSYAKAIWEKLTVNHPILVKEQNQHEFPGGLLDVRLLWVWLSLAVDPL